MKPCENSASRPRFTRRERRLRDARVSSVSLVIGVVRAPNVSSDRCLACFASLGSRLTSARSARKCALVSVAHGLAFRGQTPTALSPAGIQHNSLPFGARYAMRSCRRLKLFTGRLRRRLPAENAPAAIGMREAPLFGDHVLDRWPGAPLDPAGLVVEPLERAELVVLSEVRFLHGRFHDRDCLVI